MVLEAVFALLGFYWSVLMMKIIYIIANGLRVYYENIGKFPSASDIVLY